MWVLFFVFLFLIIFFAETGFMRSLSFLNFVVFVVTADVNSPLTASLRDIPCFFLASMLSLCVIQFKASCHDNVGSDVRAVNSK